MNNARQMLVERALQDLREGKIVLLLDGETRENEGDMIFAAEMATAEKVNFLIQNGSGIVCLPMTAARAKQLDLSHLVMQQENDSRYGTPFTQPIGAKRGTTTGISAADRAVTILTAIDDQATGADLARPGHVFPLIANQHGVLKREGHTEGSIDLMRLAGLKPAAVLCEVMNPDGTMAKDEQLRAFAKTHGLTLLTIQDIIDYRRQHEPLIEWVAESEIYLEEGGKWQLTLFQDQIDQSVVTVLRPSQTAMPITPLVRIHSSCFTSETLGSRHCDCRQQLVDSLKQIAQRGGYFIYLEQEGRGIGLVNKIRAYDLQWRLKIDTFRANQTLGLPDDSRDYTLAAKVLHFYEVRDVKLLTNNPNKVKALNHYRIATEQIPMVVTPNCHNHAYLRAKEARHKSCIELNP